MVDGKQASASLFQKRSAQATEHLALFFGGRVKLLELLFAEKSLPPADK